MSFAQNLTLSEATSLVLFKGEDVDGDRIYHYLAVRLDKLNRLIEKFKTKGSLDLANYGTVLMSGEGRPDRLVRKYIETAYGFDHDDAVILRDSAIG